MLRKCYRWEKNYNFLLILIFSTILLYCSVITFIANVNAIWTVDDQIVWLQFKSTWFSVRTTWNRLWFFLHFPANGVFFFKGMKLIKMNCIDSIEMHCIALHSIISSQSITCTNARLANSKEGNGQFGGDREKGRITKPFIVWMALRNELNHDMHSKLHRTTHECPHMIFYVRINNHFYGEPTLNRSLYYMHSLNDCVCVCINAVSCG